LVSPYSDCPGKEAIKKLFVSIFSFSKTTPFWGYVANFGEPHDAFLLANQQGQSMEGLKCSTPTWQG